MTTYFVSYLENQEIVEIFSSTQELVAHKHYEVLSDENPDMKFFVTTVYSPKGK